MKKNSFTGMVNLKTSSVSMSVFLLMLNFSAASSFFLNVEGTIITAEVGDIQDNSAIIEPFTAQFLVNTGVEGLGFEDQSSDIDEMLQLNSFPGAIESFEFQILGNSSVFFDELNEGTLTFSRIPGLGEFIFVNAASSVADLFEFDLVLSYDIGFFGDGPFEFEPLLEEATPLSSTNRPFQASLLFTDFGGREVGLDFTNEFSGSIGQGVISEVTLSPVPEPSQLGLACVSLLLLASRRRRSS